MNYVKKILITIFTLNLLILVQAESWKISKSKEYHRITDCIIEDIDNDKIDEIIISCYEYCIYVYDHSTNNIIVNNSLPDPSTNGINLYGRCDNNLIEKNSIEDKENGVVIEWSFFNVIRNNNFINNTKQAYFENSSLNLFFRNY